MDTHRRTFLELSAEVTGYGEGDLEGTGLVDDYQALVAQQVGSGVMAQLHDAARRVLRHEGETAREAAMRVDILASPILWPVVSSLIQLWYTGSWSSMTAGWYALARVAVPAGVTPGHTFVPSMESYIQQLAYRGAGAHPPGANPTGFGSWSIPPVFGDVIPPKSPRPARGGATAG